MAAVLTPDTAPWHRPSARPARPALRVVEGGRRSVPRGPSLRPVLAVVAAGLLAAGLLALALLGVAHLAGAGAAASGPAPTAAASPAPTVPAASGGEVVVRPGDTLWTIATSLQPDGDVRPLVDRLAERAGGAELRPGQRIDVSGLG